MKTIVILILMFLCQNISAQISTNDKKYYQDLQRRQEELKIRMKAFYYDDLLEENIKLKAEIKLLKVRDSVMTKRYEYLQELLFKVIVHKYDTVYIGNMRVEKFINVQK